jgi:transcriptional regulator GlxA family with amidase domain
VVADEDVGLHLAHQLAAALLLEHEGDEAAAGVSPLHQRVRHHQQRVLVVQALGRVRHQAVDFVHGGDGGQ